MAAKGLVYAERELGVHEVYTAATAARDVLEDRLSNLRLTRGYKREAESRLRDREMDLAADERGKHPDHSQTAFDAHLKVVRQRDEEARKIRQGIREIDDTIDQLEGQVEVARIDVRIAVARMEELGGYFNYLSTIKSVAGQPKPATPEGVPE